VNAADPPLLATIVTVGDELLLGETVDSNAAWLGRELSSLGIPVAERFTVGDTDDDIQRAVRRAMEASDLVLVTGGLGPTEDDRTRPAVADLLGAPLRADPALLQNLEARFRRRGFSRLPSLNRSQADVPDGASVLANPRGTAPGLAFLTEDRTLVVLLPGVPTEMREIVRGDFRAVLTKTFGDRLRPLHHRVIHTTGIPESELAGRLESSLPEDMGPVSLAYLPDLRGVDLRLTARGVGDAEAREWLDRVEAALAPVVGPYRFEAETGDLVETVSRALEDAELFMVTAESCTGGLVAKRMTDRPGSSRVFRGGIVAYSNQVKVDVLGVDAAVLEREGAVSEPVARQMALGACRVLDAPVGVGITGIAGPTGGSDEKPVGLVWYAVSIRGHVEARSQLFGPDREGIRERSAQAVLVDVLRRLEGQG
jgi:nicotinamide-nucleotide amidase